MSPELDAQTQRLLVSFHLNSWSTASDAVWWAVAALETGYDTDILRMLASEHAASATVRDLWPDVERAMKEIGYSVPTRQAVLEAEARRLCQAILDAETVDPFDLYPYVEQLHRIGKEVVDDTDRNDLDQFYWLVGNYEGLQSDDTWDTLESVLQHLRFVARDYLGVPAPQAPVDTAPRTNANSSAQSGASPTPDAAPFNLHQALIDLTFDRAFGASLHEQARSLASALQAQGHHAPEVHALAVVSAQASNDEVWRLVERAMFSLDIPTGGYEMPGAYGEVLYSIRRLASDPVAYLDLWRPLLDLAPRLGSPSALEPFLHLDEAFSKITDVHTDEWPDHPQLPWFTERVQPLARRFLETHPGLSIQEGESTDAPLSETRTGGFVGCLGTVLVSTLSWGVFQAWLGIGPELFVLTGGLLVVGMVAWQLIRGRRG